MDSAEIVTAGREGRRRGARGVVLRVARGALVVRAFDEVDLVGFAVAIAEEQSKAYAGGGPAGWNSHECGNR